MWGSMEIQKTFQVFIGQIWASWRTMFYESGQELAKRLLNQETLTNYDLGALWQTRNVIQSVLDDQQDFGAIKVNQTALNTIATWSGQTFTRKPY